MATLASTLPTLVDLAKRQDPNGRIATIVEALSQQNEIMDDMVWEMGNLETGHRTTVRTGLPAVAWRLLNKGVAVSKSSTAQIDEATGMLEARSQVDQDLAEMSGDIGAFRTSEATPFFEAMTQEMAQTVFYGNSSVAPEEFTGLSIRYSSLSATNAQNIVNGAGSGSDNSSIWLIVWGPNTIFGIVPKGSTAGVKHEDLGLDDALDSDNNRFRAYMDRWQWKAGIALRDWRFVVRICNIDISNLVAESSAANLITLMIKAIHRIPSMSMGRPAFYVNRTIAQMLDIQRLAVMTGRTTTTNAGGSIQYSDVDGRWVPSFRGIPIRTVDQLLETEATVA